MRRRPVLSIAVLCVLALFLLVYPIYVIRPFRYQGPHELAAALIILRYRLGIEVVFAAIGVLLLVSAWRRVTTLRKVALSIAAVMIVACCFLARVNVYEIMFHPLQQPTFSAAGKAKLDPDEQVISVLIDGAARAYPIRSMSYHHIVNDKLGGRAIVATY